MAELFLARRDKVRRRLKKEGLGGLLVTSADNVRYLTGFRGGDSYLLVTLSGDTLLSDSRFETQIGEECPGLHAVIRRPDKATMLSEIVKVFKACKMQSVGLEAGNASWSLVEKLRETLPSVAWVATDGVVESLRKIKDAKELAAIRGALRVTEAAFTQTIERVRMNRDFTEREVSNLLEATMRDLGGLGEAFPSIIAVGARAALPHAIPSNQYTLRDASLLLIDWGSYTVEGDAAPNTISLRLDGYCSDLTRTILFGSPTKKLHKIYDTVLKAQLAAIAAIRPGVAAREIDAVARGVITDAGFGKWFTHGTGHGIGLKVHEAPRLGQRSDDVLEAGMVITVEPGIYFPGILGVRIEDDVLVTKTGFKVLSTLGKTLDEMVI